MKKAIFAGSFDPPTIGHYHIIQRAANICDHLYVAIGSNVKKKTLFTLHERIELLSKITQTIPKVEICHFDGLLVDYAKKLDVKLVIKAIRNSRDFEYEESQQVFNRQMCDMEFIYLISDLHHKHISSSAVKEIARCGKHLDHLVNDEIKDFVFDRISAYES